MSNKLLIESVVDANGVVNGFKVVDGVIANTTGQATVAFSNMSAKISAAMSKVTEDTRLAASSIGSEWTKVTITTREVTAAQEELRAATTLLNASGGKDVALINVAAAARERLTAATLEQAAATKIATGAEESATVATWALTGAEEAMGLAMSALGAIAIAEFFKEMVVGTQESVAEMGHLSDKTGISIQTIAGLKFAAQATGVEFSALDTAMVRLERAQQVAVQGGKAQATALHDIGLSVKDVRALNPEDLFFAVTDAMSKTESSSARAAAAIALFGKGGAALIPMIEHYGTGLRFVVDEHGKLSAVTDEAYTQSKRLEGAEADLSESMRANLVPTIRLTADLLKGIVIVGARVSAAFTEMKLRAVDTADNIAAAATGMRKFGQAAHDLNFTAASAAWGEMNASIKANSKKTADEIKDAYNDAALRILEVTADPLKGKKGGADKPDASGLDKPDAGLARYQAMLDKMNLESDAAHQATLQQEVAFWEEIGQTQSLSIKQQDELAHKLVELKKRAAQEGLRDQLAALDAEASNATRGSQARYDIERKKLDVLTAAGKEGSAEYLQQQAKLNDELAQMGNENARRIVAEEQTKVQATKLGTQERLTAERNYISIVGALYGDDSTEYQGALQKMEQADRAFREKQKQLAEINFQNEQTLDELRVQGAQQSYDALIPAFARSSAAVIAQELQFASQEHAIRVKALTDKLNLLKSDPDLNAVELARLHGQILAEDQRFQNQSNQIESKGVSIRKSLIQSESQALASSFSSSLSGLIKGTETWGQAFSNILGSMLDAAIGVFAQIAAEWLVTHIAMAIISKASNAVEIQGAAGTAAANAYSSVSAIPIVGPYLAPVAAAGAYTAVLGFAEKGALHAEDGLTYTHKNELTLPAHISAGLTGMIEGGGTAGGHTIEMHSHYTINAVDAPSFMQVVQAHGDFIGDVAAKRIQQRIGTGHLKLGAR